MGVPNAPTRILLVQLRDATLELDGFSGEGLYVAIDETARLAAAEGWQDWRLIEDGLVVVTGDEHGPH